MGETEAGTEAGVNPVSQSLKTLISSRFRILIQNQILTQTAMAMASYTLMMLLWLGCLEDPQTEIP